MIIYFDQVGKERKLLNMALSGEVRRPVARQIETSFVRITKADVPRLKGLVTLNSDVVQEALRPQVVTEFKAAGNPWGVTAVLSPYNSHPESTHVMLVELSDRRYLPDPTRVPVQEGKEVMRGVSEIVKHMEGDGGSEVYFGYNCSPRKFGEREEQGGLQSLVSKWHPQIWDLKDTPKEVPVDDKSIAEGTRKALNGDASRRIASRYLVGPILREYGRDILDLDSMKVDNRGIVADVKGGKLSDVLKRADLFPFIKAVALRLDLAIKDVTYAMTTVDLNHLDQLMKKEFEANVNGIGPTLREDPKLRVFEERKARLHELLEKGYPPQFVHALEWVNLYVKDRYTEEVKSDSTADPNKFEPDINKWFAKGLGYALVFKEDIKTGKVTMRICPEARVESRVGVAEAENIALKRKDGEAPEEEVVMRVAGLDRLKGHLHHESLLWKKPVAA